jgi:ankyrin repeat protein
VLHAAVQSGSAPLVALLLDAGANPRVVDDLGETPFDALADDDPTERSAILAVLRSRRISPSRG